VQKKEKDRVLHENASEVQDPCFFGRLIAWPRRHAGFLVSDSLLLPVSRQRFPFGRAALVFSFYYP
jgi:hypothetical protein